MAMGSVTLAAERMHLTQPAVTRLIRTLEEEVGFSMFERAHGKIVPTAEGELFYREAERILNGIESAVRFAQSVKSMSTVNLRIAAMPQLAYSLLPDALALFQKDYPDVRYSIDLRQRRELEQWLVTKDIDIGLSILPIRQPTVDFLPLAKMRPVAVLGVGHTLCEKEVLTLEDLSNEKLITLSEESYLRQFVENAFRLRGLPFDPHGQTSSSTITCMLASKHLGVGISDPMSAVNINRFGIEIRSLEPAMEMNYGVIFPKENGLSPAAEQLVEKLKIVIGELHDRIPALFL